MNAEEISDFCEDISEGDLVTLLLNDDSQETGIIKKFAIQT